MKTVTHGLLAMLLVAAATSAQPQPSSLETIELPGELQRVLTDYEDGWRAGDEKALTALFVPEGFVSGRSSWLRGHDAIQKKYADSSGDLRLRGIEFAIDGNVAFIVGAYGYGDDASTVDRGLFVLALTRQDAESPWRIVADLDRGTQ